MLAMRLNSEVYHIGTNGEKEVIIFIGLVEWSDSNKGRKRKHGKRVAFKVNNHLVIKIIFYIIQMYTTHV